MTLDQTNHCPHRLRQREDGCCRTSQELYTGQLFQASRRWAERHADAYFIASARHLVIEPDTVIEPYDLAMTDLSAEDQRWRARQIESQFHRFWVDYCEFARGPRGFR